MSTVVAELRPSVLKPASLLRSLRTLPSFQNGHDGVLFPLDFVYERSGIELPKLRVITPESTGCGEYRFRG